MSDNTTSTRDNRGADNGNNQGQKRRRSRGGQNRNRNRQNQGRQPNQGRQDGNRRGPRGGNRSRRPKPKPLTWWQKLLKAIGLYKEPEPKGRSKARSGKGKGEPKSNTRVAKSRSDRDDRDKRDDRRKRDDRDSSRESEAPVEVNSKRIYLGNLSYDATESDLEELFRGVGSVRRVEIVYNRKTHQSKGYGFIEMLDADEAKRAIEILHDQHFMGRKITVSTAKSDGPVKPKPEPEEFRPANAAQSPAPGNSPDESSKPEEPEATPTPQSTESNESDEATDEPEKPAS